MKPPGICTLLLLLPLSVNADISFSRLAQLTRAPEKHQGYFHQEKYLKAVDASLRSSGEFAYERGKSIRWEILEPIHSKILMTPDGISSQQGNGELLQLQKSDNSVAAIVGEVFFAVLTADWENLSAFFEIDGGIEGDSWHVELIPRESTARKIFSRIELRGRRLLQVVILHEAGGNRTTIRLN